MKRKGMATKVLVAALGGCLLQFGGCSPLTALLGLTVFPVLTGGTGLFGDTGGTDSTAGQDQP